MIRLQHHVRRPRPRVKLTRREIFARDRHTCQYCGRQSHDLTLDHIVPRHRGGGHTWDNLVAACKACNHRKGGKTLEEARFRLLRARRSSRAATCTRCSRRTSRTSATRPGGRTCSSAGTDPAMAPAGPGPDLAAAIPPAVRTRIDTLRANGFAAYVGRRRAARRASGRVDAHDWDLATLARRRSRSQALFPGSVYENAFGTVALRVDGLAEPLQITTFRQDHDYADFRRPHRIVFGGTIEVDLARRDFTMNAIAWGGPPGVATEPATRRPVSTASPTSTPG